MASGTGIAADSEPTSAQGLPVDNKDGAAAQRDERPPTPAGPGGSGLGRLRHAVTTPTNWRVRTKLIAILIVPVVAILAYSSIAAGSVLTNTRDVNRISDLTRISKSAVSLVQALQMERTYSTGFVASGAIGSRNADPIPARQAAVNDAYRAYTAVADKRQGSFGSGVRKALEDVHDRMGTLPAKRQAIQRLVDPRAVATAFAPIIDSLLELVRLIPQGNDDQQLDDGVNAAFYQLSATELLAEQQSLVLRLIEGDGRPFLEPDFREFLSAETQRGRDQAVIEDLQSPELLALYHPTVDADASGDIKNTDNIVDKILNATVGERLDISTEIWNRSTQETINIGVDATGKMLDVVDQRVDSLRGDIQRRALLSGLLVVLILATALLAALVVARSLVRPLLALRTAALDVADRRLPDAVRRLRDSTDQNFDDEIEPVGITTDEEVGDVARAFDEVHREAVRLASEQASLRNNVNAMFVNLSRRSQGLVERQLRLIDDLENREQDPDQLANLFKLDHLATRMRRNNESLLVLAGTDTARRWTHPVPLNEVVLAAISEVEQYTRVKQTTAAPVSIAGNGVSDVVHLVAELLENATSYSPPVTDVRVTSHSLGPGAGAMIEIEDQGIGMPAKELERVNERLANPPVVDVSVSRTMGLFAVGRLAGRHGIRVQLRESSSGGITAVVRLPARLVTGDSAAGGGAGRVPALNRPTTAPALPGPDNADRPAIGGAEPVRRGGATPALPAGAANGSSNGHHTPAAAASSSSGVPGSLFDDSATHRFPNTGPFPLTGPMATPVSSDRTGPHPLPSRPGLGLGEFGPDSEKRPGHERPTDDIRDRATGPNRSGGPTGPTGPVPGGTGPRAVPTGGDDHGPADRGEPQGRRAPDGLNPDTESIGRRGLPRREPATGEPTSQISFGDSRWSTRPRADGPPIAPSEREPLPVRERPNGISVTPGSSTGPHTARGTAPGEAPTGPRGRDRIEAPTTGPRTGPSHVSTGEQPAAPERPTARPAPTGPAPQAASAPAEQAAAAQQPAPARQAAPSTPEPATPEPAAADAGADHDDAETSPIFDSVSAWFQRRSPAPATAPGLAAPAAAPAAAAPPQRIRPEGQAPSAPATPAGRPAGRSGLGGAFGHRVPMRPGHDPLSGSRPTPAGDPVVEAATPLPTRAAQSQPQPTVAQAAAGAYQAGGPPSGPQPLGAQPAQPAGREGWSSPADAGWQAAEASRRPVSGGVTSSGLPMRVPMTHLVPGSAEPAPRRRPAETASRSPEAVGGRLASFYQGVRQGRDVGVDTTSNSRRDAQEER
ncbi:nitrate- and nitrite sensing domain-containing protein [Frankia sp. R82]|uniref:sensor histidine kinase n=1 Tax=Frankia sp. R82 TaxID=2950553 RepID=UPI0020444A7E|nr:nitrate- and nitrite sensing domain-containing protein [Frankia sp. R82]MCM3885080.1 nitrate- and nitrite sensing domain-containing protein [Frankia sp. R82]